MENGPFRMGNSVPAGRQPANRPATSQRASSQPVAEEPEVQPTPQPKTSQHHRTSGGGTPPKKRSKKMFIIGAIIALLIIAGGVVAWTSHQSTVGATIDGSKYQAVFFTNGQVYFGKLQQYNGSYLKLTDVYYLQANDTAKADSKNPQQTTQDGQNVQLIKLGSEVHGPDDEMIISKDQVLFFENLKKDGKVSSSIAGAQDKK